MAARFSIIATADIALVAATAKTVLNVIAGASALFRITEFHLGFDGASATAVPGLVELCYSDETTAGTSSAQTPAQVGGPTRTVQASGKRAYTVQNGALTVLKEYKVHPQGGITIQFPLGREPEEIVTADGLCLRCTFAAVVNVRGYIEFEEG